MPRTFDMVYANSRSYREKPGTDRWRAEDESRVYQLSYDIPAEDLPLFWQLVVAKANQLRVQTRRGEPAAYFKNPQLLMQAHDLKNMFAAPSLDEVLAKFERTALAYIDFDKVDMRSCWIDVGARDFVANLGSREPAYTAAMQLDLGDLYRGFKDQWSVLSTTPAGQFDNRLKRIIGRYIMVTFNSDVGGEV
ncbi:hypothetical protein ACCO45_012817 [Purpureocillium lilacinum]|uniref:Uncharacterized protein n=1 Tax=Purpureocillium lilacinum TaxID=33203 RepID=A0ACC4DBA5_PURLI